MNYFQEPEFLKFHFYDSLDMLLNINKVNTFEQDFTYNQIHV